MRERPAAPPQQAAPRKRSRVWQAAPRQCSRTAACRPQRRQPAAQDPADHVAQPIHRLAAARRHHLPPREAPRPRPPRPLAQRHQRRTRASRSAPSSRRRPRHPQLKRPQSKEPQQPRKKLRPCADAHFRAGASASPRDERDARRQHQQHHRRAAPRHPPHSPPQNPLLQSSPAAPWRSLHATSKPATAATPCGPARCAARKFHRRAPPPQLRPTHDARPDATQRRQRAQQRRDEQPWKKVTESGWAGQGSRGAASIGVVRRKRDAHTIG